MKNWPMKVFILTSLLLILVAFPFDSSFGNSPADEFEDPYSRQKNGPPLTNVIYKVDKKWLFDWLKDPKKHDLKAKMPNLRLEDSEIKAIIEYLASIADAEFPQVAWEPFLLKAEDEMTDEELDKMDALYSEGKIIWSQARCTICHTTKGVGGFLNLGVAFDLSKVSSKINRNWLYMWIRDPKEYFPETLMPRFRFSDEDLRALVEYIIRDSSFMPEEEEYEGEGEQEFVLSKDPDIIQKGKRVIELSRCVVCHDIKGIEEILPVAEKKIQPSGEFHKLLNDVRCLTCHTINGKGGDYAPELTYEGSKINTEWVIDFLQSPDMIRPLLQQMPKFNLTEEEAKIAVQYVKENLLRKEISINFLKDQIPTEEQILEGKNLFFKKGCQACHQIGQEGGALGPNLTEVGDRLEPGYIYFHIKGQYRTDPYAVEPIYDLSDDEAMALTRFLMTLKKKGTN